MAELVVLGVASSAGTHHAGPELAPAALRRAGLLDHLGPVDDRGDVVAEVFAVDHANPTARNLPATLRVASAVADLVAPVVAAGDVPVVLGGDCTITLGVLAGVQRHRPHVGLFYLDGDADLATPASTGSGILDAMGIAHLLGLADTGLADLARLADQRLVLFGYDTTDPETFRAAVLDARPDVCRFSDREVRADPVGCARAALAALGRAADGLILHVDVDAVDSGDLPLANFPHYGTGIALAQAGEVVGLVAASGSVAAVVLTEVNPTHDPDGRQIRRYADTFGPALAKLPAG